LTFSKKLEENYNIFSKEGFSPIRDKWHDLSATLGRRVRATCINRKIEGEAVGIDTDGALTGEKKFELYNVANKINSCKKEVELTVEEIALIKERIGKSFIIEVIGQAWNLLEAKEKD